MLRYNSVDLEKVFNERVRPELTQREAEVMAHAVVAPPLRKLITANAAGGVHWYILNAPPRLIGKHFGVANSMEEAEEKISQLLGTTKTNRMATA